MKQILSLCGVLLVVAALTTAIVKILGCGPALATGDAVYQKALEGAGCEPTSSACENDKLLLCNADHIWELNVNCRSWDPGPRKCCIIQDKPGCYRPYECEETKQ